MIDFICIKNLSIFNLIFFLIIYIWSIYYLYYIYKLSLKGETKNSSKSIFRKKQAINYFFTIFLHYMISFFMIFLPFFKCHIGNAKFLFKIIILLVVWIFIISILHGIYLSLRKTKKTILGKVYWKKKDAKMFKRVIIFKLFFSIVMIILIVLLFIQLLA